MKDRERKHEENLVTVEILNAHAETHSCFLLHAFITCSFFFSCVEGRFGTPWLDLKLNRGGTHKIAIVLYKTYHVSLHLALSCIC